MPRFVICQDIHLADKAPRWRKESYCDEIFEKLAWVAQYAEAVGAAAVLCGGDVFHNPAPSRNSHHLVGRAMDWLDTLSCPFILAPGNHDLAAGRVESLPKQPLGILARHPNVTVLSKGERECIAGISIAGVEWRYHDHLDYIEKHSAVPADILLLHAAIARVPNPFYETIPPEALTKMARVVVFGHLHPPESVYTVEETLFVNVGALSRGSIAASDLERIPMLAEIAIEPGWERDELNVEYVSIAAAKPAEQVYRLEKLEALRSENEQVARFVEELRTTTLEAVTVEALYKSAQEMTGDAKVLEAIREILFAG